MYKMKEVVEILANEPNRVFQNIDNPFWNLVNKRGQLVWVSNKDYPDVDFEFTEITVKFIFKEVK